MLSRAAGTTCRVLRCTYHFTSDCIVERDPGLPQLRSKCRAKLVLEAPDQRVAKCDEVRRVNAETCMLATRITDDRLKQFAFVPTIAAIMSMSFRCCLSISLGNRRWASGASSKAVVKS